MDFHADDEFEEVLVAVDLDTFAIQSMNGLTPTELNRKILIPRYLAESMVEHLKKHQHLIKR